MAKYEIRRNTVCITRILDKATGKICQKDGDWKMLNRLLETTIPKLYSGVEDFADIAIIKAMGVEASNDIGELIQ